MRLSQSTHPLMCLSLGTFMIRTGLPILVELVDLVNSVVIFLSQTTLLRWLTFLLGSQTVILTVLLFWIYLFLLTVVFVLLRLSLRWRVIMLYQFPLTFHHIHYRMPPFIALLMSILVLIGTVFVIISWSFPWEDIFKLSVSAASSEFCELVQFGIDVYIPRWKYQVKSHSSPWFLAACAAAIVHRNHFFHLYRNHFFHLYQKYQTSESKVKFRHMQTECVPKTPTKKPHLCPTLWKTKLCFGVFLK